MNVYYETRASQSRIKKMIKNFDVKLEEIRNEIQELEAKPRTEENIMALTACFLCRNKIEENKEKAINMYKKTKRIVHCLSTNLL